MNCPNGSHGNIALLAYSDIPPADHAVDAAGSRDATYPSKLRDGKVRDACRFCQPGLCQGVARS
jgi:hypothetical protein